MVKPQVFDIFEIIYDTSIDLQEIQKIRTLFLQRKRKNINICITTFYCLLRHNNSLFIYIRGYIDINYQTVPEFY